MNMSGSTSTAELVFGSVSSKKCSKCYKIKSVNEFHNHAAAKDGKYPYCKDCKNSENEIRRGLKYGYDVQRKAPPMYDGTSWG